MLVRIPPYEREMNQWMIKNILDQGAHGIITPHIETAEQALNVVRSMRYPQRVGASDMEPAGRRGSGAGNAARFWGVRNYTAKADLWPLDPDGELLAMIQIENQLGVASVEEIAKVPGVSMLMAAPSDLGMAYGGDSDAAERAIQRILAVSKAAGIPCNHRQRARRGAARAGRVQGDHRERPGGDDRARGGGAELNCVLARAEIEDPPRVPVPRVS